MAKKVYINVTSSGLMGRRRPDAERGVARSQALRKIAAFRACHGKEWHELVALWRKHRLGGSPARTADWLTSTRVSGPHIKLQARPPK